MKFIERIKVLEDKSLTKWMHSLPMGDVMAIRQWIGIDRVNIRFLRDKFKEMGAPNPKLFAKIIGHNWKLQK